jgi:penicillin-binding protein 1A
MINMTSNDYHEKRIALKKLRLDGYKQFKNKGSKFKAFTKRIFVSVFLFLVILLVSLVGKIVYDYHFVGSIKDSLTKFYSYEGGAILDRNGKVLFDYKEKIQKEAVDIKDIPKLMQYAMLVREDDQFYISRGVSYKSLFSPVAKCVKNTFKDCLGGSGIYQQLVKNFDPKSKRDIEVKYEEVLKSIKLSKEIEPEEALGIYLNNMPFGRQSIGVEMASRSFFGHSIKDKEFNPKKACFLAVMTNAPSYYSKSVRGKINQKNKNFNNENDQIAINENWEFFNSLIDDCIDDLGKISLKQDENPILKQEQLKEAKGFDILASISKERINLNQQTRYYIRDYVENEILKNYPNDFRNYEDLYDKIYNEKLTIISTIDLDIQESLESGFVSIGQNLEYGSGLVMDNSNGNILAMLGDIDYTKSETNKVIGKFAYEAPGDLIYPFVYAGGLENSLNPFSTIFDLPFVDPVLGTKIENNETEKKYNGAIPINVGISEGKKTAIAQAYHSQNALKNLKKFGINFLSEGQCEKSTNLAFGLCLINPFSLLKSRAMISNGGLEVESKIIKSLSKVNTVKNNLEKLSLDIKQNKIIEPEIVYQVKEAFNNSQNNNNKNSQNDQRNVISNDNLDNQYSFILLKKEKIIDDTSKINPLYEVKDKLENNLNKLYVNQIDVKPNSNLVWENLKIDKEMGIVDGLNITDEKMTKTQAIILKENLINQKQIWKREPSGCYYAKTEYQYLEATVNNINTNAEYYKPFLCISKPNSDNIAIEYYNSIGDNSNSNRVVLNQNSLLNLKTGFKSENQKLSLLNVKLTKVCIGEEEKLEKSYKIFANEYSISLKELEPAEYKIDLEITDNKGQKVSFNKGSFTLLNQ